MIFKQVIEVANKAREEKRVHAERMAYKRRAELHDMAEKLDNALLKTKSRRRILSDTEEKEALSIKEAAKIIGCHPKNLGEYCSSGKIKAVGILEKDAHKKMPRLYIPRSAVFAMRDKRAKNIYGWMNI